MLLDPLFAALEAGTLVVTGNDRLARHALDAYSERQLRAGRGAWQRPRIQSWQAFLGSLADQWWLTRGDAPRRLGTVASCALWEKIILEESPVRLLQPAATARAVQSAWQELHAALLDERSIVPDTVDCRAFLGWAGKFRAYCETHNLVDAAMLPDHLARQLDRDQPELPGNLLLVGFLELTPQQKNFLACWEAAGGKWQRNNFAQHDRNRSLQVVGLDDSESECVAAALWARNLLQREPEARIGIVVPDLDRARPRIARHLVRRLIPSARTAATAARLPFNFSMGRSLRDQPLVNDALLVLSLGESTDYRDAGRLLRSPFFGTKAERNSEHGRVELALRAAGKQTFDLNHFSKVVAKHSPGWDNRLQALQKIRHKQKKRLTTGNWAQYFSDELRAVGWSRGRPLDSEEFQARQRWNELLGQFASLATVLQPLERPRAIAILSRLATDQTFQPRTDATPIQVLGLLESIGLQFDYLWVMGLNATVWPQAARPNPFIPVSLQRKHDMPHSSARREHDFATALLHSLEQAAPEVIFSYPKTEQDRILRPSPLLAGYTKTEATMGPADPQAAIMVGSVELENWVDEKTPGLGEDELARGGTSVLTDMAACPFRAFAKWRLHAHDEPIPDSGMNAAERGDLLHRVLKNIWDSLQNQQALHELTASELQQLVRSRVEQIVGERVNASAATSPTFLSAETERLVNLSLQWLEIDSNRSPFKVVGTEIPVEMKIGGLRLSGRIDRVDETSSGANLVLDYKTGRAHFADWLGERPDAPQLPLYAATSERFPDALAFAKVRTGECGLIGLAKEEGLLPGVMTFSDWKKRPQEIDTWSSLREHWRDVLGNLATRFSSGDARVDPKTLASCDYCHLSTFCRVDEMSYSKRGFAGEKEDE